MKFLVYNIAYGTGAPQNRLDQFFNLHRYLRTERRHLEKVIDCIAERKPDVTGLLEVDNGSFRTGYQNQGNMIAKALHQTVYSAVKYTPGSIPRKIPILRKQTNIFLTPERHRPCAFHYFPVGMKRLAIELEVNGIRFFLLHLSLRKTVRQLQLQNLQKILQPLRTPFLIGGDFNAFSGTEELKNFISGLGLHSANEAGLPTFPSWHPEKQLDYILYSRAIRPIRFEIGADLASDHLPVMLEFAINTKAD